jgi:hypothetical protein
MYPVIYMSCDIKNIYERNTLFSQIKDRYILNIESRSRIKELELTIADIKFPPNFDSISYMRNIERARRLIKVKRAVVSPKTLRIYDYRVLNSFQKNLMAYSIVKSIQLILRNTNKSIKNSCILVYDAMDEINLKVIYELCKTSKYIILLSKNIKPLEKISEFIISNYGVSPVITKDYESAYKAADFIITSKVIGEQVKAPIWYMDNRAIPISEKGIIVNDVDYKVPWNNKNYTRMQSELLGAILCQMEEKDVEKSLKYNGIYVDAIRFNDKILEL